MSDYIKREDAEKILVDIIYGEPPYLTSVAMIQKWVKEQLADVPSIDVVLCKDCIYNTSNTDGVPDGWCYERGIDIEEDDFCSCGEEKMKLIDLDADKEYLLDGRYKVETIARCKDCKYWQPHTQRGYDIDYDEYHNYCAYHMPDDEWYAEYWEADDFCSYGERKEN